MRPTAPENFDGDAATDRLDPTWKAQVDFSQLDRPNSQAYLGLDNSPLARSPPGLFTHGWFAAIDWPIRPRWMPIIQYWLLVNIRPVIISQREANHPS